MNLKKRLTITFITLTFLPIIITAITFIFLCGIVLINEKNVDILKDLSLESLSEITELTEETYYEISAQLGIDAQRFSNMDYLDELNEQLKADSSYIVARRGSEFFYIGDKSQDEQLLKELPSFGANKEGPEAGYFFKRFN